MKKMLGSICKWEETSLVKNTPCRGQEITATMRGRASVADPIRSDPDGSGSDFNLDMIKCFSISNRK